MTTAQKSLVGGWTAYHALTPQDQKIFDEAIEGYIGVHYVRYEVASQLVYGTNYRYKCKASLITGSPVWEAVVEIYCPIESKPHVVSITRV